MDGGTGRELLLDAKIEPDVDEDLLGDESQDPDFGLGDEQSDEVEEDELDDWFDELGTDEETEDSQNGSSRPRSRCEGFACSTSPARGTATSSCRCARLGPGSWAAFSATSAGRWDLGVPRTLGAGEVRVKRIARVRLRLRLSPSGRESTGAPAASAHASSSTTSRAAASRSPCARSALEARRGA